MWLNRAAGQIDAVVRPLSRGLHSIGVTMLALMMFLTASDVILRYFFNRPIRGSYDLTEYMMAGLVVFTMVYCCANKGNIRVNILTNRLPKRAQAIITAFSDLVNVCVFAAMAWQIYVKMIECYQTQVASTVLLIPRYPFVGLIAFSATCIVIVFLRDFLESLSNLVGR